MFKPFVEIAVFALELIALSSCAFAAYHLMPGQQMYKVVAAVVAIGCFAVLWGWLWRQIQQTVCRCHGCMSAKQ